MIAFAMKHFIAKSGDVFTVCSNNYPIDELIFLGMAAMVDPPKPEVAKAMREFQEAGIKIMMVTGDPASSVLATARAIGLIPIPNNTNNNNDVSV